MPASDGTKGKSEATEAPLLARTFSRVNHIIANREDESKDVAIGDGTDEDEFHDSLEEI